MPRNYLLLTIPFLLLSCKQEVKKTESHIANKTVSEQKTVEQDTIDKELTEEVVEQKRTPSLDLNAEWEGVYSYCVDDVRTDEFKSVTCYEISIFKDHVTVDGNTTICTGTYSIKGNKDEIELRYAGNDCDDHFFKLKRDGKKVVLYDFMNPDEAREVKKN